MRAKVTITITILGHDFPILVEGSYTTGTPDTRWEPGDPAEFEIDLARVLDEAGKVCYQLTDKDLEEFIYEHDTNYFRICELAEAIYNDDF